MKNEALEKTIHILAGYGYTCIREGKSQNFNGRAPLIVEWWGGNKGIVIITHCTDEPGVLCYANWPLGYTFDELETALK